jgi:hypothetical protein
MRLDVRRWDKASQDTENLRRRKLTRVGALSAPLKLLREWLVIEEDPWVFIFAVEPLLELFHDTQGAIHLPVIREHEERRIFAFRFGRRLHDRNHRMRRGAGLRVDWAFVGHVDKYWG